MVLLTKKIIKQLPKLNSTENIKLEDKIVIVKFFLSDWTWYACEFDGKDTFFGLVDGLELEWGYFLLSKLKSLHNSLGLGVERDKYFKQCKVKDIKELQGRL